MSINVSKGTAVTQEDFDAIKTLVGAGISLRQTAKITQRAESTVNQIAKADDLQHYIELCRAYRKPKPTKGTMSERLANNVSISENTNETRFVEAVAKLTTAVDRLCDLLEEPTPLQKEAKEFKLFSRR